MTLVAFVPILGAILLIVPGGMGVRSSLLLLDQSGNASQGTAFALQMIVVALGIAVGLFASTLVVYPRKSTSTVFRFRAFRCKYPVAFPLTLFLIFGQIVGKKRNALLTF